MPGSLAMNAQSTYLQRVPQCISPRWNWDSPNPSLASECAPPPPPRTGKGEESPLRRLEKKLSTLPYSVYEWDRIPAGLPGPHARPGGERVGPVRGHSGHARGDTRAQTRPPLQVHTVLYTTKMLAKDSVTRFLIPAFYI
jgi:hypothetical protein